MAKAGVLLGVYFGNDKLLVTSGYNIDGASIVEYIDFVSAEVVLGTGIFSNLEAGVSDLFGMRSSSYEGKLEQAKDEALSSLRYKAGNLGANAVIGLRVDYVNFSRDIIGVVAGGTAVKYKRNNEIDALEQKKIPIMNYGFSIPIRVHSLNVACNNSGTKIQMLGLSYEKDDIHSLSAEIKLKTILGDFVNIPTAVYSVEYISKQSFLSVFSPLGINIDITTLSSAVIDIQKYVTKNDEITIVSDYGTNTFMGNISELNFVRQKHGQDAYADMKKDDDKWDCSCGYINPGNSDKCDYCHRSNNNVNVTPIDLGNEMIKCPKCSAEMRKPRSSCYKCGAHFVE